MKGKLEGRPGNGHPVPTERFFVTVGHTGHAEQSRSPINTLYAPGAITLSHQDCSTEVNYNTNVVCSFPVISPAPVSGKIAGKRNCRFLHHRLSYVTCGSLTRKVNKQYLPFIWYFL